jgi:hypothetical protein
MSDPSDSSPQRSRARGFRILGWLAVASMLALALLGPSAAGVAALSGAVYTSNADGSVIDANHYDTKGDVYLTGGPCNGGSHLAAGDYYFEVVQPAGGGALLSTDAVGNRKFTVGADGFISSTSGTHATHAVNCTPAVTGVTIQLIPYGDSSNGTYKLQVATASSVEACAGFDAASTTFKFCQQADQKSDNFHVGALGEPTIATQATSPVVVGATISDTATVSGGASPTGTVDFALYGPGDPTCAGTAVFTSNDRPLSAGGTATSASFTTTEAGSYHWIATYSGDDNNLPAAGACGDAGETSVVNPPAPGAPTIATRATTPVTVGATISDTAIVSGGTDPTGTVDFALYGPNDATCSGEPIFTSNGRALTNGTATSAPFTTTVAGTYRWIASYNGDANDTAVSGSCNDANETSVVNPPGATIPAPTPTATPGRTPPNTATDISPTGSGSDGWRIPLLGIGLLFGVLLLLTPSRTVRRRR